MNGKYVPSTQNETPALFNDGEFCYLSPYKGEVATKDEIKMSIERLKGNYTNMSPIFWAELQTQVVKCGFTGKRLFDAVDYVIANNPYKEIRIAEILNFGRGSKLYTYRQMEDIVYRDQISTDDFEMVELPDGRKMWKSKTGKY